MLSNDQIAARLDKEAKIAEDYCDSSEDSARARNMHYYFRRPRGDEIKGRSQVQSSDVADTVNHLVPALVEVFTKGDRALEAVPRGPEDVEAAEQATETCNYVLMSQNPGFHILRTWIKEGLLLRNAVVKAWAEADTVLKEERYQGLTPEEWDALQKDADIEITEAAEVPGQGIFCTVRRSKATHRICIEPVPADEICVSPDTRSPDIGEARYVRHKTWKSRAQMIGLGYDADVVDGLASESDSNKNSPIWLARRRDDEERDEDGYWYEEHYLRADLDEDGQEEYRLICKVGGTVLRNEIIADNNFASWCPKPLPHEWLGECPADDAVEIQDVKTVLWRQTMDSLYLSVNPRWQVVDNQVNLDDLMTPRPGSPVRMSQTGAATPLLMPFVGQQTFPMLEYVDGIRELRTGVSRVNGNDVASINKTATGASIAANRDQQQVRLMAREFGEGLRRLFRVILRLLSEHQTEPLMIRLRNQFVPVDPRAWATEYDFTINVGLGTTDQQTQMQMLAAIWQSQMMIAQSPLAGQLLKPENLYHTQAKLTELSGFKSVDKFWTDPSQQQAPQGPQQPPIPLLIAQMQTQAKQQTDMHKAQVDAQAKVEAAKIGAAASVEGKKIDAQTEMMNPGGAGQRDAVAAALQALNQAVQIIAAPKQTRIIEDENGRAVGAVSEPVRPSNA